MKNLEQAKKVVVDHLASVGFPKIDAQKVFDELPAIWAKLKHASLAPDISFSMFQQVVVKAYNQKVMEIELNKQFAMAHKPPMQKVKSTVAK